MTELELILTEAGAALEWPETPDIAAKVADRLRVAPAAPRRRRFRIGRPLALALASLLVLAAGAAAASGRPVPALDFPWLAAGGWHRAPATRRSAHRGCCGGCCAGGPASTSCTFTSREISPPCPRRCWRSRFASDSSSRLTA